MAEHAVANQPHPGSGLATGRTPHCAKAPAAKMRRDHGEEHSDGGRAAWYIIGVVA
jgi:hypothetical protein